MKKFVAILLMVTLILSFIGCTGKKLDDSNDNQDEIISIISKDEKFGAALLSLSQKEFEDLGFSLGDSCNVLFQNGYELLDVPYYNGYYVRSGNPVIVAYPGDPYVRITLNNLGIWDQAGLSDGDSVTITLSESGKYLSVQEALGQVYSFDRSEYLSDEEFTNFRSLSGGKLKDNYLYRGASPVDNSRRRSSYVDRLLENHGIGFIINLADSEDDMKTYLDLPDFNSTYTKGLYDDGCIVLLDMGSGYTSQVYKEKVVQGLKAALDSQGPIYIHCMEGKDRTGFVCLLLEALAGADFDEMKTDYLLTYDNYFRISKESSLEKYEAIADLYFIPFLEFLHGTEDLSVLKSADYTEDAKAYLKDGGMDNQEIEKLIKLISK